MDLVQHNNSFMALTEPNNFLDFKAQTTKQDTVTNQYQGSEFTDDGELIYLK